MGENNLRGAGKSLWRITPRLFEKVRMAGVGKSQPAAYTQYVRSRLFAATNQTDFFEQPRYPTVTLFRPSSRLCNNNLSSRSKRLSAMSSINTMVAPKDTVTSMEWPPTSRVEASTNVR